MSKKSSKTAKDLSTKKVESSAEKKDLSAKDTVAPVKKVEKTEVKSAGKAEGPVAKNSGKNTNKRHNWIVVVSVIAAVALVLGVSVMALSSHDEMPKEDDMVADVSQEPEEPEPEPESEPEPEEELPTVNTDDLVPQPEVTNNATYQVAAYKPRYLSIPSIGLYNIPIVEIGVNGNTLGDPANYRLVGWHYQSALPGQQGVAMIDGHGGDLGDGIFKTLPRAPIGADIIIEMGDGRKFTYRIVEKQNKTRGAEANAYMHTAYESPQPGVPALTLITCTGQWLRNEQTYLERLFVRAVLVN